MKRYKAKYIVSGHTTLTDAVLSVDAGVVMDVAPGPFDEDLGNVAIVPGIVNAHSHAFQRMIRGRTEYLAKDRPQEDFWSWRTQMYAAAASLDPVTIRAVARMTFLEMLMSGVTSVGEFHYIHHQPDGTPYAEPNTLAHAVIDAARSVGLRIHLLGVAYQRGGYDRPASLSQSRFIDRSLHTYLRRTEALALHYSDDTAIQVGFAPHSIRAVPRDWLEGIAARAKDTGQVIHIHACEQQRELAESRAEYGLEPIELLEQSGILGTKTTLVHATHLNAISIELIAEYGCTVCACPTTERNLGDGFLPVQPLLAQRVPISLGSDSHAQINLWEDARLVEYHERLREERRNIIAAHHGTWFGDGRERLETADLLWPLLNQHGADCLDQNTGRLERGTWADFCVIDLDDLSLAGTTAESLKSDLVFSLSPSAIHSVYVNGTPIVDERRHPDTQQIIRDYQQVMGRFS